MGLLFPPGLVTLAAPAIAPGAPEAPATPESEADLVEDFVLLPVDEVQLWCVPVSELLPLSTESM